MISAGFNQEDVAPILSIPLNRTGYRDRLVWHHTVTGDYSVRSGYRVAVSLIENDALGRKGQSSSSEKRRTTKCGI